MRGAWLDVFDGECLGMPSRQVVVDLLPADVAGLDSSGLKAVGDAVCRGACLAGHSHLRRTDARSIAARNAGLGWAPPLRICASCPGRTVVQSMRGAMARWTKATRSWSSQSGMWRRRGLSLATTLTGWELGEVGPGSTVLSPYVDSRGVGRRDGLRLGPGRGFVGGLYSCGLDRLGSFQLRLPLGLTGTTSYHVLVSVLCSSRCSRRHRSMASIASPHSVQQDTSPRGIAPLATRPSTGHVVRVESWQR